MNTICTLKEIRPDLKINQATSLGILLSDFPSNTIGPGVSSRFLFYFPNYILFFFLISFHFSFPHTEVYLLEMLSIMVSTSLSRIYAICVKKKCIFRELICLYFVSLGIWVTISRSELARKMKDNNARLRKAEELRKLVNISVS